jgi:hypothetical protein
MNVVCLLRAQFCASFGQRLSDQDKAGPIGELVSRKRRQLAKVQRCEFLGGQ